MIRHVCLEPNQEDTITWKFTTSENYTAASAYKAQFMGCTKTPRIHSIWKMWALPKCKFFTWFITQDHVWTSDWPARHGWDHSSSCPLCRSAFETSHHLTSDCRFTKRVWDLVATWTAQQGLKPSNWKPSRTTFKWWSNLKMTPGTPKIPVRALTMLVTWEMWKKRNARVFQHREISALSLFAKIKKEANDWSLAGEKHLKSLIRRE